jgi:hypothetical protein
MEAEAKQIPHVRHASKIANIVLLQIFAIRATMVITYFLYQIVSAKLVKMVLFQEY